MSGDVAGLIAQAGEYWAIKGEEVYKRLALRSRAGNDQYTEAVPQTMQADSFMYLHTGTRSSPTPPEVHYEVELENKYIELQTKMDNPGATAAHHRGPTVHSIISSTGDERE